MALFKIFSPFEHKQNLTPSMSPMRPWFYLWVWLWLPLAEAVVNVSTPAVGMPALPDLVRYPVLSAAQRSNLSVVGLYHGPHDNNVAIAIKGKLVLLLPLEMLYGVPNFGWIHFDKSGPYNYSGSWRAAVRMALRLLSPTERATLGGAFDFAVVPPNFKETRLAFFAPHRQRTYFYHHAAHGFYGFYDSGFASAVVITADGGADGSFFNIYIANRSVASSGTPLRAVVRRSHNLGRGFTSMGDSVPEVR
eukprot:RCo047504